jgi:hypothetical protein
VSRFVRPGPERIGAGACPGGIVVHVYAAPSNRLMHVSPIAADADIETIAGLDVDATEHALFEGEEGMCLVAYDGDSGRRMLFAEHWGGPMTVRTEETK